ncbi:MAG: CpsB/CapC family capsule biosynthesis tyrosine phosphatase [Eggerthellaceae bacterium]
MWDIHCHILPGVDDGSPSMDYSMKMFAAARKAGVTGIVCTPHCRDPYFDYQKMWASYHTFKRNVGNFPVLMGFEVAYQKLVSLGVHEWAPYLGIQGTDRFLLELDTNATEDTFKGYETVIYELQTLGFRVIIAHPERYEAIRKNPSLARRLIDWDCELQASADFIAGGRLGNSKRSAKTLLKEGAYSYIASDAHTVNHYSLLSRSMERYGSMLRSR